MVEKVSTKREWRAPALRISHFAYGRERQRNKVYYFVDPEGKGGEKAIPEQVVLKRWRKRKTPTCYRYQGVRLSPNFWRALDVAFPDREAISATTSVEEIHRLLEISAETRRRRYFSLPPADSLQVMFRAIGEERMNQLLERHLSPERANLYGTPDLFLYGVHIDPKQPPIIRFVEVKKPKEPIRPDQAAEIEHLNSIGIPARVLRLIERPSSN